MTCIQASPARAVRVIAGRESLILGHIASADERSLGVLWSERRERPPARRIRP